MHDDPLSEQIQRLISDARPGPSGVFSLDLNRVEMVFRGGGEDWFRYWVSCAAFYGAEEVQVNWNGRALELSFLSIGPEVEELRALLLHRQRGPRYLALGMLAASQQGFDNIVLESPRGQLTVRGFDETLRSRNGMCRFRARASSRAHLPELKSLRFPVMLNGTALPQAPPGQGLRLLVDGFVFDWQGLPLLPPGEALDWPVCEVRMDARLIQPIHPPLHASEMERLQAHFAAHLLERSTWSPEAVEWLLLRSAAGRWPELLQRLPAPPDGHPLSPAYHQRRLFALDAPLPPGLWEGWPAESWPALLENGLAPSPLPLWLLPSCARLPGRAVYPYLLRASWMGEHFDAPFLQALLSGRRDTLGGNVLLAHQLRQLKPAQRPVEAARFCLDFLQAVVEGRDGLSEWAELSLEERARVRELTEDLGA
ncbi:hypothetical protein ABS71_11135 [bacterium SCN 62-11]|nr:hypothetical protein [Candidatus Eremiobacteraeota bacterium]ODT67265.1 MAG: hypothetical protein ABS71_11135 [bacterium SCN 62-11]